MEGRAPSRPSSGALRFIPYGCRTRGGHDRAWPSIEWRLGPAATRDRGPPCWRDALRRVRFRALGFVPYGCRTRGGHDRAWPSIGCRLGPAATRDRGPPCWRDALRRVRLLGPCGLSRMAAEQEAAMTEHGPPLDAVLGPRPRGTVALHVGGTRSVASVFRR